MNTILLTAITIIFIAGVGVFTYVMLEVRSAMRELREFLNTTEISLRPALEELEQSLKSIRNVTDNVSEVADDVKRFSSSVRRIGEDVERVGDFIDGVATSTTVNVSGWKAGIRAGLEVLLHNILAGKRQ